MYIRTYRFVELGYECLQLLEFQALNCQRPGKVPCVVASYIATKQGASQTDPERETKTGDGNVQEFLRAWVEAHGDYDGWQDTGAETSRLGDARGVGKAILCVIACKRYKIQYLLDVQYNTLDNGTGVHLRIDQALR